MRELAHQLYLEKRSMIVAFEGWDAAGKGGAIRRFTEHLDPRGYEVFPIAAPQGDSAARHYLWRFWRRIKPPGERQILIFDRSWYGRVLVERVEGFATEAEWRRAYGEINDFEGQLIDAGMAVAKIWVHISLEEQLRRFEARKLTPHKQWKLTDEDWRNREKWSQYEEACERHGGAHEHGPRPLDGRPRQRQAVRARRGDSGAASGDGRPARSSGGRLDRSRVGAPLRPAAPAQRRGPCAWRSSRCGASSAEYPFSMV